MVPLQATRITRRRPHRLAIRCPSSSTTPRSHPRTTSAHVSTARSSHRRPSAPPSSATASSSSSSSLLHPRNRRRRRPRRPPGRSSRQVIRSTRQCRRMRPIRIHRASLHVRWRSSRGSTRNSGKRATRRREWRASSSGREPHSLPSSSPSHPLRVLAAYALNVYALYMYDAPSRAARRLAHTPTVLCMVWHAGMDHV